MITHLDARGIIVEPPAVIAAALAAELGRPVSRDVSALARMLASETEARHPETAPVRAHIALNDLADLNRRHSDWHWTIEDLITYSSMPVHRGHFGEQRWGRRYASDRDGAAAYVLIAEQAIAEHARGEDPTGGALKFIDKRSMLVQHGTRSFESVASAWATEGLHPFQLAGYPEDLFVFRRTA
jgi:hypothetical protein